MEKDHLLHQHSEALGEGKRTLRSGEFVLFDLASIAAAWMPSHAQDVADHFPEWSGEVSGDTDAEFNIAIFRDKPVAPEFRGLASETDLMNDPVVYKNAIIEDGFMPR